MNLLKLAALASSVLSLGAWSGAATLESVRTGAERQFLALPQISVPALNRQIPAVPKGQPISGSKRPVIFFPQTAPANWLDMGPRVGSVNLPERLDLHRAMLTRQLGAQTWDIGVAGDKAFKVLFFTFRRPGRFLIKRINNLQDLRGKGVIVTLDSQTSYNFRVVINIFDPVRGSTLHIDPVNGTQGLPHEMSTGELLDSMRAKSYVFNASGEEYWLLYTTDIDPNTSQPVDTRSLVFFHEAGTSSKFWPVAESSLRAGQPQSVSLGDNQIYLVKGADGRLDVYDGPSSWRRGRSRR